MTRRNPPSLTCAAEKVALLGLAILGLAALAMGCDDGSPLASGSEQLVVTGYIHAGDPASEISVAVTLPLDADSTLSPAVNGARVVLIRDGQSHDLELVPGDSGLYRYTGPDLIPATGDLFRLQVEYGGQLVTATTEVPPPPAGLTASAEQLVVEADTLFLPGQFGDDDGETLTVSWEVEDDAHYLVTVESIEAGADSVESIFSRRAGSYGSQVMRDGEAVIQSRSIACYGRHEVRVYRANEEYAELSAFRVQNLNDLAEPPSNIDGGLGLFTAFNSAAVEFEAVRP